MGYRPAMPTATLLLSCPDATGIVAAVATFVAGHRGNIIHADQHTDVEEAWFVQRVEWQLDGFDLDRRDIAAAFAPIAERLDMRWGLHFSDERRRTAVLVSRQGHCLYDLMGRWELGELPTDLALVISNHEDHRTAVERAGVPFHRIPASGSTKADAETEMLRLLAENRRRPRGARALHAGAERGLRRSGIPTAIINIHHSFLPAFAGARPYHQAHERGVKLIGATAHYVTPELDQGPIIEQDVVRVSHRDSVVDLVRKGRDLEKVVLARAVDLHPAQPHRRLRQQDRRLRLTAGRRAN